MAPIGAKLWETAFQTIPDISFFDAEKTKKKFFFVELWMAVYPSNMAAFGLKLWENAFQTIPNISFSTSKKKWQKFSIKKSSTLFFDRKSTNCLFLRSYGFLDLIGRCASKSYPQSFDFQLSTTFGGGVKEIVSIFFLTFGQKWLQPFSFFGSKTHVSRMIKFLLHGGLLHHPERPDDNHILGLSSGLLMRGEQ